MITKEISHKNNNMNQNSNLRLQIQLQGQPVTLLINRNNIHQYEPNELIFDEPIMRVHKQQPIKWTKEQRRMMKPDKEDCYRIGLSSEIALKEEQIKYHNRMMIFRKLKKLYSEPYKRLGNMKRLENLIQRRRLSLEKWSSYEWRMRILKELIGRKIRKEWPNIRRQYVTMQEVENGTEWKNWNHNFNLIKEEIRYAEEKVTQRTGQLYGWIKENYPQYMEIDNQ